MTEIITKRAHFWKNEEYVQISPKSLIHDLKSLIPCICSNSAEFVKILPVSSALWKFQVLILASGKTITVDVQYKTDLFIQ